MDNLQVKRGWRLAVVLIALACLLIGMLFFLRLRPRRQADRLFREGDYTAAREIYLKIGDADAAARCEEILLETRYHQARALMGSGDYRRAMELLEELGDYQDSARFLPECKFLLAGALRDAGELDEAREMYLSLGDYPGCQEALEGLPPFYYDKALSLARDFEMEKACEIWEELGDFRNCEILLQRGKRILEYTGDSYRTKLNDPSRRFGNVYYDHTYICDEAYIVIPENPDSSTRFFLYFPGGRNEELNMDFFYTYLMNPAPNTLAVFMRKNGLPDLSVGNRSALAILEQAAADLGLFVDQPIVAGSSLGVYPTMQFPLFAWHEYGIQTRSILSLDAGNDWWEPLLAPTEETATELSLIGTELFLFQSPSVGTEHPMIRRFLDAGDRVTVVECLNDEHEQISYDALGMGFVDWVLGDRSSPYPSAIYQFIELS